MNSTLSFDAPVLAGRFRLLRHLGAGGMGEVWVAEQLATGQQVALKLLPRALATDPDATARFELEARSLCRVQHEHIVRVIDCGRDPDRGWFLATELLEGETLASWLAREGRLPPSQAVRLGAEILAGLQAVHEAGIVHRDLKPENVMLVAGAGGLVSVRLLDFGIAKLLDPGHRVDLTLAGQVFGTPAYLSPEQALGREVDPRADLYACGVLLYRALSGQLPFDARTPAALALRHATDIPRPLPDSLAAPLRAVVERALAKEPDERFADATAMRAALLEAWPESEPFALPGTTRTPIRPLATGAVPRLGGGVSRTVLLVRLAAEEAGHRPEQQVLSPTVIARDVVEAFGGRIAWISNEGLLAELGSPTDTLQCAAAVHDRLKEREAIQGHAVEVRAAVTAGEVVRAGRVLQGEAVVQAELLAESAAAGEVVFTHGVYLAMTRSEIVCEPWPGRDPGVGQKLYRLCVAPGAPRAELPFGGATLHRAQALTPRRVAVEASRLAEAGLRAGLAFPPRMIEATRPRLLAAAQAIYGARRLPGLAIAALALLAGAGAAYGVASGVFSSGPVDAIEAAIVQGRHEEAGAIAEEWFQREPSDPEAQAWRGRALAWGDRLPEAELALGQALGARPELARVDTLARALVRTLDRKDADRTLVLRHRTEAVERALLEATRSVRYWERWNAVRTLERLGMGGRIDWVEVNLLDLQYAGSCGTRMQAARKLAELGDPRAIEPLLQARGMKDPAWACNLEESIDRAIARLRLGRRAE